jgi:hypothetical protein
MGRKRSSCVVRKSRFCASSVPFETIELSRRKNEARKPDEVQCVDKFLGRHSGKHQKIFDLSEIPRLDRNACPDVAIRDMAMSRGFRPSSRSPVTAPVNAGPSVRGAIARSPKGRTLFPLRLAPSLCRSGAIWKDRPCSTWRSHVGRRRRDDLGTGSACRR